VSPSGRSKYCPRVPRFVEVREPRRQVTDLRLVLDDVPILARWNQARKDLRVKDERPVGEGRSRRKTSLERPHLADILETGLEPKMSYNRYADQGELPPVPRSLSIMV
jgi:hypothetical protein